MKIAILGAQIKKLSGGHEELDIRLRFIPSHDKVYPTLSEWLLNDKKIDIIMAEGK